MSFNNYVCGMVAQQVHGYWTRDLVVVSSCSIIVVSYSDPSQVVHISALWIDTGHGQ